MCLHVTMYDSRFTLGLSLTVGQNWRLPWALYQQTTRLLRQLHWPKTPPAQPHASHTTHKSCRFSCCSVPKHMLSQGVYLNAAPLQKPTIFPHPSLSENHELTHTP